MAVFLLLQGCANIVPPEGGKKDETPPELLSIEPADSSLNIRPSKIILRFNEYVEVRELEKNLVLSPLLPVPPTVLSYGKRVEIKLLDTQLHENTTYMIGLGNAIVDNHEGNPYKNFNYLFSTGSYFDSLQLRGQVIDAATGRPDTNALMILYPAEENDTAVMRQRPRYAVKADASGNFLFKALPQRPFRIYALQDANSNYTYDYGEEKIGFIAQTVLPSLSKDSLYYFYMFKEVPDTAAVTGTDTAAPPPTTGRPGAAGRRSGGAVKSKLGYYVHVDTNTAQRTFELTEPLTIDLFTPISSLDTAKVYLSYDNNGIEVEAVQQLKADSSAISLSTQWQSDKVYTLRLVKGWATDSSGSELPPGKYFFRTKREEDYGKLIIHVNSRYYGDSFLLYIYKGTDSIYLKPVTDSVVTLPLLSPGDYSMRIIADGNRNGKWDPGKLLLRLQPEKVFPYNKPMPVKAGWDNEIDFLPEKIEKELRSREDQGTTESDDAPTPAAEEQKEEE